MNINSLFSRSCGCWVALAVLSALPALAQDSSAASDKEQQLIEVLRSDAPGPEKALACKSLAVFGSSEAVADLAKLLSDPQLHSWARIALEAIPGAASNKALRGAAQSLEGRLLIGTINSIGVREDAEAVDLLTRRLGEQDPSVASAAAIALGRIGNQPATEALRQSLASSTDRVRSSVAEACVLCAERLLAAGKSAAAAEIYDQVRSTELPKQRIIEATRGAILAHQSDQGAELLLSALRSTDKQMFQLALGTIREFPGNQLDGALVAELADADASRAALLVQAMADRSDTVDLAVILKAAGQGRKLVRLSAIDALRRIGNASCLTVLISSAGEDDEDVAGAAQQTLAELPGDEVNERIAAMLPGASGAKQILLLNLVGQRRIDAVKLVVSALDQSDSGVRKAALYALGETVDLEGLSVLISQVTGDGRADLAPEAQRALRVACIRMPNADKCTEKLVAAMNRSPKSASVILEIVSEVGGTAALSTLADSAKSADPLKQDIASRLLGKWNNTDAAPVLLDLASTAPAEKYQIRALRGYIGIVRKFPMSEKQRVQMCQSAWDASKRDAEKQLILDVLKIHPSKAGLALANQAKQIPALKDYATAAAEAIQSKVKP